MGLPVNRFWNFLKNRHPPPSFSHFALKNPAQPLNAKGQVYNDAKHGRQVAQQLSKERISEQSEAGYFHKRTTGSLNEGSLIDVNE